MRDVKPGDVVFHLIDRNAIVAVSLVAEERDDSHVVPNGTQWPAGKPAYFIRLKSFTKLPQQINRTDYLDKPEYRTRLKEIAANNDSLFFDSRLELRQGAYLTIAPPALITILDEVYTAKTGNHLPLTNSNLYASMTKPALHLHDKTSVTPFFSEKTFQLLKSLHEQPTQIFYQEHKNEFKTHLETPLADLFQRIGERLPSQMTELLEMENRILSRIPKNDYGRGGAWDFLWGAFYPKGGRRIDDGQLYVTVNREGLKYGFSIADYGKGAREMFASNLKAMPADLMAKLSLSLASCEIVYGEQDDGYSLMKLGAGQTKSLEEWIKNIGQYGPTAKTYISIEKAVLMSGDELAEKIADLFERLFPLFRMAKQEQLASQVVAKMPDSNCKYWTFSPGEDAESWEEFYQNGIMAIGWDKMGDLRLFKNKDDIRQKLQQLWPSDSDKKNDVHACWQFAHDINSGDIIFAKQGSTKLLGFGVVEDGGYEFDDTRANYKHVRKVKWIAKGQWEMPADEKMAIKTLTDVTAYGDFVALIAAKVGLDLQTTGSEGNDGVSITPQDNLEHYDKLKAMDGLFLGEPQFDEMLEALKEKKNVVLQGAPGVGKTFVAKRLAYALIESNNQRQIETIQFHQSYSYEDFIQGFRPNPNGHFDLKFGIFYQFCRRAQRDEAAKKPYVFIIDEINRGNLSKIFGELMMLVEPDKRGKEHAIPLAYSQNNTERFYIPENLHLIGMMNTADRSLAMVDYALRRRFRFITLRPEFGSDGFGKFLATAGATPELTKKIVSRMNSLNEVIAADTKNLGTGYQIGHSYFCPRKGINPDENWYRRVIDSEILPLIQEYWFDNEQKVKEQRSALLA